MKGAVGLVAALVAVPLSADLGLKPLHPDETVEQTLSVRFSADNALRTIATVEEMLDSLKTVVVTRRDGKCDRRLAALEAKFGDRIIIGVANYPTTLEGTIRLQRLAVAELRYQLAASKHMHGEEPEESVRQALAALETERSEFKDFWDSVRVVD